MEAATNYGPRIATLREVHPFFVNVGLWEENKGILGPARPFFTRDHSAFSKIPLGDALVKDGKHLFLIDNSYPSHLQRYTVEWAYPITKKFLEARNIKMSDSNLLFVVEDNYQVRREGETSYRTEISSPLQDMRVGAIPSEGLTTMDKVPVLFGEGAEPLKAYVEIDLFRDVKVGLVSTGNVDYDIYFRGGVHVSDSFDDRFGMLVYETGAQAPAPDMKALVAGAATTVENTLGRFGAVANKLLQPVRDLINKVQNQ